SRATGREPKVCCASTSMIRKPRHSTSRARSGRAAEGLGRSFRTRGVLSRLRGVQPGAGSGRLLLHGDAVLSDLIGKATFRFGCSQLTHAKMLVRVQPSRSRCRQAAGLMSYPEVIERPKLQSEVIEQMEVRGFEAQFVVKHVAPQRPSVSVVGKHPDLSSLDH